ncbi:MAG: hypothetical protein ACP5NX_02970 [Candidatus Bilamarchaeaceae archaeon]
MTISRKTSEPPRERTRTGPFAARAGANPALEPAYGTGNDMLRNERIGDALYRMILLAGSKYTDEQENVKEDMSNLDDAVAGVRIIVNPQKITTGRESVSIICRKQMGNGPMLDKETATRLASDLKDALTYEIRSGGDMPETIRFEAVEEPVNKSRRPDTGVSLEQRNVWIVEMTGVPSQVANRLWGH